MIRVRLFHDKLTEVRIAPPVIVWRQKAPSSLLKRATAS